LVDERRMIEHQFHQAQLDLNQWMRLAATVMAHASRAAAIIAPPKIHRCRFKHLELISTHGPLVLLVLVLEEGLVRQQVLSMERPRSQEDLSRVSRWLNDVFAGLESDDIRLQFAALPAFEVQVGNLVVEMMEWIDHNSGPVYRDGLVNVLSEPEFVQNAGQVAQVFTDGGPLDLLLWDMLSMAAERGSVQVVIGGEGQRSELSDFGLVLSHYGVSGYATGALGVLGPVRMPYARAVSVVRFMSRLLSDLIQQLYGDQLPPPGQAQDLSLS
jgi:heat-inducible transcriptional repressor